MVWTSAFKLTLVVAALLNAGMLCAQGVGASNSPSNLAVPLGKNAQIGISNANNTSELSAAKASWPALALSEGILKEVASFLKAHPKMKDEFMPAEQDCLDGKRKVDTCEAEIRRALADMKKEVAVNAKDSQLNIETEMTNRLTLTTVIWEMNNRIQYGKGGRTGIAALARITNPIFAKDIAFISQIDQKLQNGEKIWKPDIQLLQSMLVLHSDKVLDIHNSFSPKKQKEFLDVKNVAIDSKNLIIR